VVIGAIADALRMTGLMTWAILWALVLGFLVSGAIQAVVSHSEMAKLLPDDKPRSIVKASLLGAASSSCSYAAVAIARSIFHKGGNFTSAMAFQFASTNLVIELGILLAILLGWQFTAATWTGGIVMIVLLVTLMRLFVRPNLVREAKRQADRGIAGRMEGHASMDMSVHGGALWRRLTSSKGFTAISHYYWMDWASVWLDVALGLLLAGAAAAWVPHDIWARVFDSHDPVTAKIVGPLIGPLIAVVTFVCSVGNVPLAAVLWNGGASFGGVIAFIFADLIILPILDIYRRYYGLKVAALLGVIFYAAMVGAGYVIELLFGALHLVPVSRSASVTLDGIGWNYTTWLNLIAIATSALLFWRFMRTGGPEMLREMERNPDSRHGHSHHHHA
jgi:uncharacterized membrane protein YraQ (UPF0718 family)